MLKVVCIVQARMGSTRLAGKVLKKVSGETILAHVINRLKRVGNINEIVVATTVLHRDDVLVKECERLNVEYFRGSEEDVLARYYFAAKEYLADVVVRVTSDCPLIDSEITEIIIQYYLDNIEKYDYVSNTVDRTFPRGLDIEVFSFNSLERAFNETSRKRDREHVTPYIWENPKTFRTKQYKNIKDYSEQRWTLDTEEDLELITKIYENFTDKSYFGLNEILKLMEEQPDLKYINMCVEQKKLEL